MPIYVQVSDANFGHYDLVKLTKL